MIPSITGHDRRTVLGKWHRGPDHLPFPAVNALNHAPCWETVGLFPFFPAHFLHLAAPAAERNEPGGAALLQLPSVQEGPRSPE